MHDSTEPMFIYLFMAKSANNFGGNFWKRGGKETKEFLKVNCEHKTKLI